jgi:tetratricopeptide (TPR) repeat protein
MRDVMPRARELAARALALEPESSDAHSVLGNIAFQFDHDWSRAEAEFEKALAVNPSNVMALRFYGLMLLSLERFDEAKEILRRAIRVDPSGKHRTTLAWAELDSGNFDAALEYANEFVEEDPSAGNRIFLGFAYLQAGRRADAAKQADYPVQGADADVVFDHALLNAILGRTGEGRAFLARLERGEEKSYVSGTQLAMMYGALGENERALDLLEKDFREGELILWLWYRGVFFDSIRDDPRFVTLLRQYGLPAHSIHRPSPPSA